MDDMIDPFPDFSNVVPSAEKKQKPTKRGRPKKNDYEEEPSTMNQNMINLDSMDLGSI